MDKIGTSVSNDDYKKPEYVCFLCRQVCEVSIESISNEQSHQQHFNNLFKCCSNYQWPDALKNCFHWNFQKDKHNCELCPQCLSSLEKIFEMNQLLDEMRDGIHDFINLFAKQVLDFQSQYRIDTLPKEEQNENSVLNNKYENNLIEKVEIDVYFQQEDGCSIPEGEGNVQNSVITCRNDLINHNGDTLAINDEDLTRNQEQNLIDNYKSSKLGVLYPLKNVRVALKRLDITGTKVTAIVFNDGETNTLLDFECDNCQIVFHSKSALTQHVCIHKRNAAGNLKENSIQNGDDTTFEGKNKEVNSIGDDVLTTKRKRKAAEAARTALKKFANLEKEIEDPDTGEEHETNSDNPDNGVINLDVDTESQCENQNKEVKQSQLYFIAYQNTSSSSQVQLQSVVSFKYKCDICKTEYEKKDALERHLLTHGKISKNHQYTVAKRFKCSACKFSCNSFKKLSAHSTDKDHSNEKPFKCVPCGRKFSKMMDLNNHKFKFHFKTCWKFLKDSKKIYQNWELNVPTFVHRQKPFKCQVCEKTFTRKSILTRHSSIHVKKSTFKCSTCNEKFQWRLLMNEHIHVHNGGNFKCNACGKEFLRKYLLLQHRLIHTKAQNQKLQRYSKLLNSKKLKCRICHKIYLKKSLSKNHHLVHKRVWGNIIASRRKDATSEEQYTRKLTSMNLFECNICQNVFPKRPVLSLKSSWKHHCHKVHKDENICECDTCGKLFKTINDLQDHKSIYNNQKENHHCEVCNENFHTKFDFEIHRDMIPTNCYKKNTEDSFECGVCDNSFKTSFERSVHMRSHGGSHTRLKCKICDKFFGRQKFLSHWKTHSPNFIFNCGICDLKFNVKYKLTHHKIRVHSDERPYKCPFCDSKFKFASDLNAHEETVHSSKNKKYICEVCGDIFRNRIKYADHRRRHLNKAYCKLCDKTYTSKKTLHQHNRICHDTEVKKLSCEYCPKMFLNKSTLTIHMRVHTGDKPFECQKCDRKYRTKPQLQNHASVHDGLKLSCKICGKTFSTMHSLQVHMSITHGEKKFQCEVCGKKCNRQDNLITHMRSHNGDKPYQCQECGKSFTRLDNMNVHLKWHEKMKIKSANKQDCDEGDESDDEDC